MANNILRAANNEVKIEGILKDMRLHTGNSANGEYVSGSFVVLVEADGNNSEVTVNVASSKLTKSGKENPSYKNIMSFRDKAVSIGYLMSEDGGALDFNTAKSHATRVRCLPNNTQLSRNEYYDQSGQLRSTDCVTTSFIRVVEPDDITFKPEATFDIEVFFKTILDEKNRDGEETGRVLVNAIVPIYGGKVIPMNFVAEDEIADYIRSNYERNKTGHIWGSIISTVERKVVEQKGFGKPLEKVTSTFKRENLITGGDAEQFDDDSTKSFDVNDIKKAWEIRETETLPNLLQKSKNRTPKKAAASTSRPAGFGAPQQEQHPAFNDLAW